MKAEGVLIGLTLLFGAALCAFAIDDWYNVYQLANNGQPGTASVVGKDIQHGKYTNYYLSYTFQPAGQQPVITLRTQVTQATYDRTAVGAQIPVTYLADHPATAEIAGSSHGGLFLASLFGLAIVCVSLIDLRKWRRKRHLRGSSGAEWRVSQASIDYYERQRRK